MALAVDDFNYMPGNLELLTATGFKAVEDIKKTDMLAQYNVKSGWIEFAQPYYIKSLTCTFKCRRLRRDTQKMESICVLPVDNVVPILIESNVIGNQIHMFRLGDTTKSQLRNLVRSFRLRRGEGVRSLSCHDRLNIAIQADGSVYKTKRGAKENYGGRVNFGFAKEDKMDRLETLLEQMGLAFEVSDGQITTEGSAQSVRYSVQTPFFVYKKFEEWLNLCDKTYMWCRMFLDELSHWDCHVSNYGLQYSNKCWSDVSLVQAIATLCGYDTSISLAQSSGVYSLNINMSGNSRRLGIVFDEDEVTQTWYSVGASLACQYFVARGNRTVFLVTGN